MPKLKQYFHIFLMVSGFSLFGISSAAEAQPTVTFTAIDGSAAEAGQETAGFSVTRTDDGNTAAILRVYVQTGGTAAIGSDYSTINMSFVEPNVYFIDIRANDLSTSVILTPIRDNLIEDEEDITITLLGPRGVGNDYTVGTPSEAGATISDDVAEVILTLDDGEAAEAGQNTAGFTVTRSSQGNTAAILRVYVQTGGTATIGSDYSTTNMGYVEPNVYFIDIRANDLSTSVILTPVFEELEEGTENILVTLLDPRGINHDYTVGSPSQVEVTILDFQDLIFKDSFEQ